MGALIREFREWVAGRQLEGVSITVLDEEHITLVGEGASAAVNFYCFDGMPPVVELHVLQEGVEDPVFFLHFELEELKRAQELFGEMVSVLQSTSASKTTHVLLCCTVGMTTTMFAGRLTEAAKTLSLDYTFEAKALEDAKQSGGDYAAVLLAPQVGFRRREVAEAFPNAIVVEIPTKIFGAYDAAGALRMLMGLLGDTSLAATDSSDLRPVRQMKNDKTILLISVINRPGMSCISYRVYDRFELLASDEVHKCHVGYRDLEDVLATIHLKGVEVKDIDAVGIALPGSVDYGKVTFAGHGFEGCDVERALVDKFGVTVFVDNNANAAAVGCYVQQDEYDSVTLHTQQVGYLVGGEGTVANGHLLRGRRGIAGELGPFNKRVFLDGGLHLPEMGPSERETSEIEVRSDIPWRADRMLPILATTLLANICTAAPDVIYIAYDLIDDMEALRKELATCVPDEFMPDLIHITDYHEKIFVGEMALVLQRLNTAAK